MRTSGRFDPGWEEEHEPETKENKSRGRFETARLFPSRRISKTSGIGRKTDRYEKDCPKRFSMHFRTPPCGGSKIRRSWKPEEKIMQLQGGSIKTVQVGPFLSGGNNGTESHGSPVGRRPGCLAKVRTRWKFAHGGRNMASWWCLGVCCPICHSRGKRIGRKFWMRLVPASAYYVCPECNSKFYSVFGMSFFRK